MKHGPIHLIGNVVIGLSTRADGDMRTNEKTSDEITAVLQNRERFLVRNGCRAGRATLVKASYDTQDFCRYRIIDETWAGRGMSPESEVDSFDMLATRMPGMGLFLPLGDCLGAVIYDVDKKILAVSHLGRHSVEQYGARRSIEFFTGELHSAPRDLRIWLSPAAGAGNYPLHAFDNRGLRDVACEQFISAGVQPADILGDDVDTTLDPRYFSHSKWRKDGSSALDARFAIVAKMIE